MVFAPSYIYRDYETPGVPSSGDHKPVKGEIIDYLQAIESGGNGITVPDRTSLKAVDTVTSKVAYLTEAGREGVFLWKAADYSAPVAADTGEYDYVKADAIASSAGAWVRGGLAGSHVIANQNYPHLGFGGNFNNGLASVAETLAFTGTTSGPRFTRSIGIKTQGGNANGPDHGAFALWLNATKGDDTHDYLTSLTDGEIGTVYIYTTQGRKGDGDGIIGGVDKVFGTGTDTGSGIGIEFSTRAVDTSGVASSDHHSLVGFQIGLGSGIGRNAVGFMSEAQIGTSFASYAAWAGQDLSADTTYYFAGFKTRAQTAPSFSVSNDGAIVSNTASATVDGLTLISTNAGAAEGNNLAFFRDSASPAVADIIAKTHWDGRDSAGNRTVYAAQYVSVIDPADGTEDGRIDTYTIIAGTLAQRTAVGAGFMVGTTTDQGVGTANALNGYYVGSNKVVGARVTGYAAMTGSPDKATAYATSTVTLAQLAGRVAQLQADLTTHGLIAA